MNMQIYLLLVFCWFESSDTEVLQLGISIVLGYKTLFELQYC